MNPEIEDLKARWLDLSAHVERLAAERRHYLELFDQSPEAYVITDADGAIVDSNGAASDILQRRRRSLLGKPLAGLVALDHRKEFRAWLQRLTAREPGAARSWKTVFEAPELRIDATLTARLIERAEGAGGICWLVQGAA